MVERIALYRPLTGIMLHPDIEFKSGSDTRVLNGPGDISFSVSPEWATALAEDKSKVFGKRQTLVIVERANGTIRQAGLVDDLDPQPDALNVSCGGLSMLAGQSGPWEGHQGWFLRKDPVSLFYDVWQQVQSYENAALGIRLVGDTTSGSTVGTLGTQRWYEARSAVNRYKGNLERWEAKQLAAERRLAHTVEQLFKASGIKRVGAVTYTEQEPEDPGYKHLIWIKESTGTPFAWRDTKWVAQQQARYWANQWRHAGADRDEARANVDRLSYLIEPHQEVLDELEAEQEEHFSLYFWQNHDMTKVIEQLTELGPFEYREEASWTGNDLDLKLRVGAPKVGVRRPELHLELGHNIQDYPPLEYGDLFTGVTLFGAGEGSEVLSAQRTWELQHAVRNILTETDKGAVSKQLTNAAANKLLDQVKANAGLKYTSLIITHDTEACSEGSFDVGDEIFINGQLVTGDRLDGWVRIIEATHEWDSNKTTVEVEQL